MYWLKLSENKIEKNVYIKLFYNLKVEVSIHCSRI